MFPAWRLQLRAARAAVADGRWDEAAAMLQTDSLREFLPAKTLSLELAERLVKRAQLRLQNGLSAAGWNDLNQAASLGADERALADVRRREAANRLEHAVATLARGDAAGARQELRDMERRHLGGNDRRSWQSIAEHIEHAQQRAGKGDLPSAIASLEQAQRHLPADEAPVGALLRERLTSLREVSTRQHALDARLHAALAAAGWTEVLAAAESLLELAPQHSAAQQARHKAWQAVGMEVTQPYPAKRPRIAPPRNLRPPALASAAYSTRQHARNGKVDTVTADRQPGKRVVAWIDEVGAFLVCLGDEIVLGQPSSEGGVDVPILADLSRRHATIRRDGESYVLVPIHQAAVDGRDVLDPTVLRDKSVIKLGGGVELRFRKPHALSATAVLEFLSHHRTEPAVDGVVLMSESCILGPQGHSHVRCRHWTGDLVLFRRGEQLMCRTQAPVQIDGQSCVGQTAVGANCRIEGDEFALTLEEI